MSKPASIRNEKPTPDALVHVDIRKLCQIPDGGGYREVGIAGRTINGYGNKGQGYAFLHHTVDENSRQAFS